MTKSFDKILRKGKKAVTNASPDAIWKQYIGMVLYDLHRVNALYGKDEMHHIAIKQIKCDSCSVATFLAMVRDVSDPQRAIKFHLGEWRAIDDDHYLCPKCK